MPPLGVGGWGVGESNVKAPPKSPPSYAKLALPAQQKRAISGPGIPPASPKDVIE
jgi:hypothetical protein